MSTFPIDSSPGSLHAYEFGEDTSTNDPHVSPSLHANLRPSDEWESDLRAFISASPSAPFSLPDKTVSPRESFAEAVKTTEEVRPYRNWFHSITAALSLLGARAGSPAFWQLAAQYQKLIKAELLRGQLQATYAWKDADRLNRARSPLVREGYGRAVRTGLWVAAAQVRTEQIRHLMGQRSAQLSGFWVCPVSRAFEYPGLSLVRVENTDQRGLDLTGMESVFIPSLGVQLIARAKLSMSEIDGHFGRHALRACPSECADICAEDMVRRMGQGRIEEALQTMAFALDGATSGVIQRALSHTQLRPTNLLVPEGVDPLTSSSVEQLQQLSGIYQQCLGLLDERMPFHVQQNLQVVQNLIGDLAEFCEPSMPTMACGDLIDALDTIFELGLQARHMSESRTSPQYLSLHMDRFYQSMQEVHRVCRFQIDWAGREFSLHAAVGGLLFNEHLQDGTSVPRAGLQSLRKLLSVERAPHALAMIEQIKASLPSDIAVAYLAGGYYETPGLFDAPLRCDQVTHPDLPHHDLIVIEPHPNNAAESHIYPHDPVALIEHLFSARPDHARTIIMDVTLNHLGEEQMADVLQSARPYIEAGKLNLVILQSGTKFVQNGMDLINIGFAAILNQGDRWADYRRGMEQHRMHVPNDDANYIACLLSQENRDAALRYLERVRHNTASLSALLEAHIPWGRSHQNAFELCVNEDDKTVYLALRLTDAYVSRKLVPSPETGAIEAERAAQNAAIYRDRFCPAFNDLAAVNRASFGFNITNFGECGQTIRVTLGIEEASLIEEYARRIVQLGIELHDESVEIPENLKIQ